MFSIGPVNTTCSVLLNEVGVTLRDSKVNCAPGLRMTPRTTIVVKCRQDHNCGPWGLDRQSQASSNVSWSLVLGLSILLVNRHFCTGTWICIRGMLIYPQGPPNCAMVFWCPAYQDHNCGQMPASHNWSCGLAGTRPRRQLRHAMHRAR